MFNTLLSLKTIPKLQASLVKVLYSSGSVSLIRYVPAKNPELTVFTLANQIPTTASYSMYQFCNRYITQTDLLLVKEITDNLGFFARADL